MIISYRCLKIIKQINKNTFEPSFSRLKYFFFFFEEPFVEWKVSKYVKRFFMDPYKNKDFVYKIQIQFASI